MTRERLLLAFLAATVGTYWGFIWGRTLAVPGGTEFWTKVGPPIATIGAGLLALTVGFIAFMGVTDSNRRSQRDNLLQRQQEERNGALTRCWERFTWIADRTALTRENPVATPFTPQVATELIVSLETEADRWDDPSLIAALNQYQQMLANMF